MTTRKDFKNHVRTRQARTGESYSTARLHVLHAGDSDHQRTISPNNRITAIVLKANQKSMRVRIPGEKDSITLRASNHKVWHTAPGQFIETSLTKRWIWSGDAYASGTIERAWTDVPALGLTPLPLIDQGYCDLNERYDPYLRPDPYAELWESASAVPRQVFEFDGIA